MIELTRREFTVRLIFDVEAKRVASVIEKRQDLEMALAQPPAPCSWSMACDWQLSLLSSGESGV